MINMDQKQKNFQGNTTNLLFARMTLPVPQNVFVIFLVYMETPIKVGCVVKRYAVRKTKKGGICSARVEKKAVRGTQGTWGFTLKKPIN